MNQIVHWSFIVLLFIVGLGLLMLTRNGFLSFRKPHIVRQSPDSQPERGPVAFVNVNGVRVLRPRTARLIRRAVERYPAVSHSSHSL